MNPIAVAERDSLATPIQYALGIGLLIVAAGLWFFIEGNRLALAITPLAAALIALSMALHRTARRKKYGQSECLITEHLAIGGELTGEVATGVREPSGNGFQLRLTCVRREEPSGEDTGTRETTVFETDQHVSAVSLGSGGVVVPFRFALPPSCEPTRSEASVQVIWRLRVTAALPGVGYLAEFEVPVSRRLLPPSAIADWDAPADGAPVEITVGGDRSASEWFTFGAFLTVCLTLAGFLVGPEWPPFLPGLLGIIGLAVLILAVEVLVGKTDLRADKDVIRVRRTRFGVGRTRTIAAAQVVSIKTRDGISIGSRAYFDVAIGLVDGSTIKILKHLNLGQADAMAARIAAAIRPSEKLSGKRE